MWSSRRGNKSTAWFFTSVYIYRIVAQRLEHGSVVASLGASVQRYDLLVLALIRRTSDDNRGLYTTPGTTVVPPQSWSVSLNRQGVKALITAAIPPPDTSLGAPKSSEFPFYSTPRRGLISFHLGGNMQSKKLSVEIGNSMIDVTAILLPDSNTWIVNGTLTDIEFENGAILPAVIDFGKVFKATVIKKERHNRDGVIIYKQDVYCTIKQLAAVGSVLDQLPVDCYVVVSSKTLRGYKHPRMICAERNGKQARTVFEVIQ